jgi:glycosyltransferase involved in cell wall biosynthesis
MKVLHVIDCMRIGGAQRRLFQLLKGMQGYENVRNYIVFFSDQVDFAGLDKLKAEVIIVHSEKLISYETFKKFRKVVAEINPDIVHSWQLILSFYTTLLSFEFKFRHLNAMINESSQRRFFNKERLLAKIIIPFANVVVSNSRAGLQAYKVKRKKDVFVVYNGFDFERIEAKQNGGLASFFESSCPECTVVGMVARFDNAKDYPTIIKAICSLLEKERKIKFIAVGDGRTLEQCKKMVPSKFQGYFYFAGKRDNVDAVIPLFDIGVLSTFTEGISNSIMEYMAFRKPVIVTDCPGNREIVIEKVTGLFAKSRDIQDWVDKLSFLIENRDTQLLYGMNGFARLQDHFHLEKMTLQYRMLYSQLAGETIPVQTIPFIVHAKP